MNRAGKLACLVLCLVAASQAAAAEKLPLVLDVERQPLQAQVQRVVQALDAVLGAPLSEPQRQKLQAAFRMDDDQRAVAAIQEVLDPLCLVGVNINPESRVKAEPGPAARQLAQHGWRVFLVKVHNEAGVTAPLRCLSPQAPPLLRSSGRPEPQVPPDVDTRQWWLDIDMVDRQPLTRNLSGLPLEYRIVALYSRDAAQREATLSFDVGQGTQDLGFRSDVSLLFTAAPAVEVRLEVIDHDGTPTTGSFIFRDAQQRVYPSMTRRLAPDFFFHEQVYRAHGESVLLPPGKYEVTYTRGPEYRIDRREITVPERGPHHERFRLRRWIDMASLGWYSGDHHVHAAGCKHYDVPTQGVEPRDMMRHILGEDLNVGCVLSWGPCWYYQKQFFTGQTHELSTSRYLMRYDVEVSGFPSSHCGHLCLLRLKEDDYPGTTRIEQWPSWDLPILKWAKEQGGVVGFAHSGWGLKVDATTLPSYEMPPFDGIGANEYIVDVTHDACDFISTVDTPSVWELNIWYHTLNCGYTTRISGETDFPCIYGERVGLGRAYVRLGPDQPLDFDAWVQQLRNGRSYVSEGLSHLFDFQVNGLGVGEPGHQGRPSVLALQGGTPLEISVRAAALLGEQPNEAIRRSRLDEKPYWHIERARIGNSRRVPVELIVNGQAVQRREIEADGSIHDLTFRYTPERSSWVALRIFPSSHTNPVFVELDGQPIRASRRSAQWCLRAVDVCWEKKSPNIRAAERDEAAAAYEHARQAYARIVEESFDDR
jgi:hypothetical protein